MSTPYKICFVFQILIWFLIYTAIIHYFVYRSCLVSHFLKKSELCKHLASLIEGASKQCTVDILHYCHFRQDNSVVVGKVCHISYK